MLFTGSAKFLTAYIQKYENPETKEKSEYYKVTLFSPDGYDKSPNFPITEELFKSLKLDEENSLIKYRNASACVFTIDVGSYNNKPTVQIVDMVLAVNPTKPNLL